MSLTVNRTEEKEANWADLLDGLRYAGFRRSVSTSVAKADTSAAAGAPEGEARAGGAKRNPDEPESG